MKEIWITRVKVLLFSSAFASVANYISSSKKGTPIYPWQIIPGLLMLLVIIILGCMIDDAARKHINLKLPNIIYISLLSIMFGIPSLSPIAGYFVAEVNKINLLALCTPILAFAGISLGKDMDEFKKQGVGIVVTSLVTIAGTYLGGVIVAQLILMVTGG